MKEVIENRKMKYSKIPDVVNLELTHNCNANCKFCTIRNDTSETFVPLNQILKILDILSSKQVLRVNLFGGEPFIYPWITDVIQYAHAQGFYVSAVSNGIAFNEELIKSIQGSIDGIGISLHGIGGDQNKIMGVSCYDTVLNSLKLLNKYHIMTGLNITVTKENYNKIQFIVEEVTKHCEISGVALNRYISNSNTEKAEELGVTPAMLESTLVQLKYLSDKYKNLSCNYAIHFPFCIIKNKELRKFIGVGCGFGQNYCAIDYSGNMKMCSYKDHIIGNIFIHDMSELWENSKELKRYRTGCWMSKECDHCRYDYCKGGCKISGGSTYGMDPLFQNSIWHTRWISTFDRKVRKESNDKFVLMNPFGSIIALNHTALEIYKLCDGKNDISTIAHFISKKYDQNYCRVKSDVWKCIEGLEKSYLIKDIGFNVRN